MTSTFSQYLYEKKYKLIDYSNRNDDSQEEDESDDAEKNDEDLENSFDDDSEDEFEDEFEDDSEEDEEDESEEDESEKDPDKQGLIRTIKNAHLIYKRKEPDGSFSELWIYAIDKGVKDEFIIRKAILDGTDIDQKAGISPDTKQRYELWTCHNRQMMKITGLEN